MAVFKLPLLADTGATPHYTFSCELDGVTYSFDFAWNDRDGSWFMQIGDSEENLLHGSMRVVLGQVFAGRDTDPSLPPGMLIAKDTSGANLDPGLEDLGSRVEIWYWDKASTASVAATGSP